MLKTLIKKIRSRSIVTAFCVYLGSAWVVIQVVGLIVDIYDIPSKYFNAVIVMFIGGIPITLIFSWFHGKKGRQTFKKRELFLHAVVIMITILTSNFVSQKSIDISIPEFMSDRSIAVLPFANISDDKSNEYFSDGMTEDILTYLSRVKEIRVISRTSVMKYKRSTKSIKEIAKELNVSNILEGSVRKDGENLRITAQLINAKTDSHIWADNFDRKMDDIFKLQSEISQIIVEKLKIKLLNKETLSLKEPTKNMAAYNLLLKGKSNFYRFNSDGIKIAIEYFKKAIEFDPSYTDAWAFLGIAYHLDYHYVSFSETNFPKSLDAVNKALELSPDSQLAYTVLGYIYKDYARLKDKKYQSMSIEAFKQALEIDPNFMEAITGLASQYNSIGLYKKAIPLLKFAYDRDPTHMIISDQLMLAYLETGKLKTAYQFGKKTVSISPNYGIMLDLFYIAKLLAKSQTLRPKSLTISVP